MDFFSTENFPVDEQVDAAIRFRSSFAQLVPSAYRKNPGFKLINELHYFGEMLVGREQRDACIHVRTTREVSAQAMDAFFFIMMRQGYAQMDEKVGPGQIQVIDSRQPFKRQSTQSDHTAVILKPDVFGDGAAKIERLHGKSLKTPLVGLLADYISSLTQRAASIPKDEQAHVVRTTKSFVEACLFPGVDSGSLAEEIISDQRIDVARRYIEKNLFNQNLSASHLVSMLSLSRRQIYRLFEPYGGVENYIKQQRLSYARDRLSDPNDRRLIKEIAYDSGFTNATEFSRCFRKSFGYTPQEVRNMPVEKRQLQLSRNV